MVEEVKKKERGSMAKKIKYYLAQAGVEQRFCLGCEQPIQTGRTHDWCQECLKNKANHRLFVHPRRKMLALALRAIRAKGEAAPCTCQHCQSQGEVLLFPEHPTNPSAWPWLCPTCYQSQREAQAWLTILSRHFFQVHRIVQDNSLKPVHLWTFFANDKFLSSALLVQRKVAQRFVEEHPPF